MRNFQTCHLNHRADCFAADSRALSPNHETTLKYPGSQCPVWIPTTHAMHSCGFCKSWWWNAYSLLRIPRPSCHARLMWCITNCTEAMGATQGQRGVERPYRLVTWGGGVMRPAWIRVSSSLSACSSSAIAFSSSQFDSMLVIGILWNFMNFLSASAVTVLLIFHEYAGLFVTVGR